MDTNSFACLHTVIHTSHGMLCLCLCTDPCLDDDEYVCIKLETPTAELKVFSYLSGTVRPTGRLKDLHFLPLTLTLRCDPIFLFRGGKRSHTYTCSGNSRECLKSHGNLSYTIIPKFFPYMWVIKTNYWLHTTVIDKLNLTSAKAFFMESISSSVQLVVSELGSSGVSRLAFGLSLRFIRLKQAVQHFVTFAGISETRISNVAYGNPGKAQILPMLRRWCRSLY